MASELNRRGASGTDFLVGDCRNGLRTIVTDAQVNDLLSEFDTNMWPKEAAAFSIAPDRTAVVRSSGRAFGPAGEGDNIVVLVDNVRDSNYYDMNNDERTRTSPGSSTSQLRRLLRPQRHDDRRVRLAPPTGANPPNEPVRRPLHERPARPYLYEGVFAHEYQHLLESYQDRDETAGSTRACLTSPRHHGLRNTAEAHQRRRLRLAHPVLPRLASVHADEREPEPPPCGPENCADARGATRATARSWPTTARRGRSMMLLHGREAPGS